MDTPCLRTLRAAAAVALLALAVGCGGDTTSSEMPPAGTPAAAPAPEPMSTAGPAVDVCTWLTSDEIEAALGVAPSDPQPQDADEAGCAWTSAGNAPLVSIASGPREFDSFNAFALNYVAETGEEPRSTEYRPVTGIGDWAMYLPDHRTLQVNAGERWIEVTVAEPAGEEEAVALAESIVGRLP